MKNSRSNLFYRLRKIEVADLKRNLHTLIANRTGHARDCRKIKLQYKIAIAQVGAASELNGMAKLKLTLLYL